MAVDSLDGFDVLVLDIEGTVCSISFVHDVLFPYALDALSSLDSYWDSSDFAPYRGAFPEPYRDNRLAFEDHVRQLVAQDIKAPYLKALQGHLWRQGYETGHLKAPVFPDVGPLIKTAYDSGKKVMIYSSGSVPAQKLFFSHTTAQPSDLTPFISAWFDTVNAGPKTEVASYAAILSSDPNVAPARWLFLSDNLREVGAARASGMRSLPVVRPGNDPLPLDDALSPLAIADFAPGSIKARLKLLAGMPEPIEPW